MSSRPLSFDVRVSAARHDAVLDAAGGVPHPWTRGTAMRVIVIVKATKESEAESKPCPSPELLAAMSKFNEELVKAGVMLDGAGLRPSKDGKRVRFPASGTKQSVIDGPFAETKELVAGYWLWQVKSLDEAVEWLKRCPHPHPGHECDVEIRQLWEESDFQ
jgi:hypothetical protein